MATDIIKSAAKFLQTPAKPERRLEEKIRFLIQEKNLTQFQLIAALKQANLYNIETIEPILTMCYFQQNEKLRKKSKTNKQTPKQQPSPQQQQQQQQPPPTSSSWSPWWSTMATLGVGLTSFIASYTVSTTASQNTLKKSEEKVSQQLDSVKTEIKEQADLDRERQHRDLMEVVNLLKTQVQCVQQNLGVLKQSIEVIQTQMKYNSMNIDAQNVSSIIMQNKNIRGSTGTGDDGSVISSGLSHSNVNDNKPNLVGINRLLAQDDDGLDWLNTDIVTSNMDHKIDDEKKELNTETSGDNKEDINIDIDIVSESDIIYHMDYKDMILTLPTDIVEIKQQLTQLLKQWQNMVLDEENELSIERIKSGFNALIFYINKILKTPFMPHPRKINTYNKQYKERLSKLPDMDKLLALIGFEKDNVFWTLPLLFDENDEGKNDEKAKKIHDIQIKFLTAFKDVLGNLFNVDGSLPFGLSEGIMKIKQEREGKNKEKESENKENYKEKVKDIKDKVDVDVNVDNVNVEAPKTEYSNKFMEIAKLLQEGKKPDDVQEIDDMPPDPNAQPSESKMEQQQKPFEKVNKKDKVNEDNDNDKQEDNDNKSGLSWFENYEAQSQAEATINEVKKTDDGNELDAVKDDNNDT